MSTTASTETNPTRRELARRVCGGLKVTLFRDTRNDSTNIELHHTAITEAISFRVPAERALDAFRHPFAYLEQRLWRP